MIKLPLWSPLSATKSGAITIGILSGAGATALQC